MTAKPLTWAQKIIWAGQAILPDSPHYNQAYCCDLHGPLDRAAMTRACDMLCADVDALRLVFNEGPSGPYQSATGAAPVLHHHTIVDRQAAQSWMESRALLPFDLSQSASALHLLEITPEHYVLFVVQHHLVTDGRAASLLIAAWAERYEAALDGRACGPAPRFMDLPPQMEAAKPSTAFDHTASIQPMPLYGRDQSLGGTQMVSVPLEIDATRSAALTALAQRPAFRSFTPLMAMQNILATLVGAWLARVTAQSDVAFGMPQHNRIGAAQRDVIGLFMEILPLGVSVQADDTFHSLYERVTQAGRDMIINGGPGTTRVDLLRHRNVLLNVFGGAPVDFAGLRANTRIVPVSSAYPAHDVKFEFEDLGGAGAFNARMEFDAGRFDATQRSCAVGHFLALFDAFCQDPEGAIAGVDILGVQEHADVDRFNARAGTPQPEGCVLDVFLAHLSDAPALRLTGSREGLSHHALDRASTQMAHLLMAKGAGVGDKIAIHLPRSVETVIAILAIHKIGAAFVPVEPSLPEQRRDFILNDTAARIIISNTLEGAVHPSDAQAYPDTPFAHYATPDAPAYVIYTSGSTGQPKGVVIGHRALLGYCQTCIDSFGVGHAGSYAFFSAFGFDLTLNSIFMPLISQGETVVYPEGEDGADLSILAVLEADEVDFAKPTPSHLRLGVLSAKRPAKRLRVLPHSGEAFPEALARQAHDVLGAHLEIINEYGPTEAVIGAMMHPYDPAQVPDGPLVPLGRPMDGMRIYVLSAGLAHQPVGVPGEIAIGGRLAQGYLNRAELTGERFVADPHNIGEKLYLTGDLGVFASPDDLRYLGRLDDQIKLNGIRLELGEIEHAIARVPSVEVAVVSLRTNPAGRPALVAYVQGQLERAAIVSAARDVLPASIALAAIIPVTQIPVSSNGKINRNALPEPTRADWQAQTKGRAPVGPDEVALAQVFAQVLGMTNIGADDDFYDIGGDSLGAVRITNAARTKGLEIAAIDIFRHRSIANLARNLSAAQNGKQPARAKKRRQFSRVTGDLKAQLGQALRQTK